MKIRPHDYQFLKEAFQKTLSDKIPDGFDFENAVNQTSAERIRWDIYWLSEIRITDSYNVRDTSTDIALYDYMNDTHIDTAFRNICKDIGLESLAKR